MINTEILVSARRTASKSLLVFGKGKIMTNYTPCTFTFKFDALFILVLFVNAVEEAAYFANRDAASSTKVRTDVSSNRPQMINFTSSLPREGARNVYIYKSV